MVHLIAPEATPLGVTRALVRWLEREESARDRVVVLGSTGVEASCARLGLRVGGARVERLWVPRMLVGRCGRALRTYARSRALERGTPVRVWTAGLQRAANRGFGGRVESVTGRGGMPIDLQLLDAVDRDAVRAGWGVRQGERVVALVGDPVDRVDAKAASYQAGVMRVSGFRVRAVVQRGARGVERARRFAMRHDWIWDVTVTDEPLWSVVVGADVVMYRDEPALDLGAGSRVDRVHAWPLEWALAAGTPVLAEKRAALRADALDSIMDGLTLAPAGDPLAFNRALARVLDDLPEARERVRAARDFVRRERSMEAFLQTLQSRARSEAHAPERPGQ
jgi:hypothetical protein